MLHAGSSFAGRSLDLGNNYRSARIVQDMDPSRHRLHLLIRVGLVALLGAGAAAQVTCFPPANPMLRVLAPDGITLSRRQLANPNTGAGLAEMVRLLEAAHRPVPEYLRTVCDEYSGRPRESARFAVGCYWEGERELGKLPGVVASRTGMIGRDEVVELHFDPAVIAPTDLSAHAARLSCFRGVPSTQAALVEDPEQQHTLANHPEFAAILMTPLQRTKVNAALSDHQDLAPLLSPTQLRMVQNQR